MEILSMATGTIILFKQKWMIFLLLIISAAFNQLYSQIGKSILLRNVTLIDKEESDDDAVVSILIKDSNLEVVTKDEVSIEEADIAFTADGGILLGKLETGEPASFMILDQDPRENINALLDTKSHTVFAIKRGTIVINKLLKMDPGSDELKSIFGWSSYAPPPVALPLSYQSHHKWNMWRTKPVTIILVAATMLENTRWIAQDDVNKEQIGDLKEFNGGSVRGARAGFVGTFNFENPWTYMFFVATSAYERGFETGDIEEFTLFDYKLDIPLGGVTMSLGKQKEPISMERIIGLIFQYAQQERTSVSDGLLPSRNVGIVFNSSTLGGRMTWAAGAFNRWFDEGRSFESTASQLIGRVTGVPYITEDESNLFHVGFGGRYTNAKEGIHYRARTEIFRAPYVVDTELMEADNAFTYNIELAWRKGPFLLASEIMRSNVSSTINNNPGFGGYHVTASWIISGEMRKYNKRNGTFDRVRVAQDVNSGGWGTWEVSARWSELDLTDGKIQGGEMGTFSLGLNWWPTGSVNVNANYRYSTIDRYNEIGTNHGIVTRLTFMLE